MQKHKLLMQHSKSKVVGNLVYRCRGSSPCCMRENHYAIPSTLVNFLRSRLTREHNASYFLISWKELPLSECKISYFIDVLDYIERNYSLNPLFFLALPLTVVNFAVIYSTVL